MHSELLLLFLFSIAISFLLSGMEAGVFALSRLHVRQRMRTGNRRAIALFGYLENPENFLWTILVGNTLSNLIAASVGVFGLHRWFRAAPELFWPAFLASLILFYAFCELLPKMLFRVYPDRLCMLLAVPFRVIHVGLQPLVFVMAWFAGRLGRWSGGKAFTGRLFANREELRMIMQESAHSLTDEERTMINRVFDLHSLTVRHIAIPLARAVTILSEAPLRDLMALCRESGFSRIPVWKGQGAQKRIAGVVSLNALLYEPELDLDGKVGAYLKPALFLDGEMRLETALRHMQRTGQRLAVVTERDQAEVGVVSLEDVLQVIFGEVST